MSEPVKLTYRLKDYIFHKDPYGEGILIEIDGIKVLLPTHVIVELLK